MKEKKSSSPFTERAYDISMNVGNREDLPISERWSSTFHVSELSRKVFFALFSLIAGECLKDNYVSNDDDEFGNIVDILFRRFNLDKLDDKGSLEGSIEDYIKGMEDYSYFLPKDIVELSSDKSNLKKFEFGTGYDGDLDSVVECIRDILKSLRDEKIQFWKSFFEKYKEDKEAYDLGFRTKAARRKSDLEKFSKIDIDEYIDNIDEEDE